MRAVGLALQEVACRLDLPPGAVSWLERMERPPGVPGPTLPGDAEAEEVLERIGADPQDRADTIAARPSPETHAALWWVLDRIYHTMLATMGAPVPIEGFRGWPPLPDSTGPAGRHLYVWVHLAVLPHVRRYHADRGISEEIFWASLGNLGLAMRAHRSTTGKTGLGLFSLWGPPLRLRGADYQLGRLGFNRAAFSMVNGGCDGFTLGVHMPPLGALDPAACDRSFATARRFFPRHFPEEPVAFFTCHSWAMDPQLAGYLPEASNILRFQQRFHILPLTPREAAEPQGDQWILGYVFHRSPDGPGISSELLDDLPQDTALQRAYAAHLRSGGHWHARTGWFAF